MSMSKPLDVDEIEKNKQANKRKRAKYTVGVVAPNGLISEHFCPPPDDPQAEEGPKQGDCIVRWVNGEPQVAKRWKARGYILYAELAARDGEPEKYEAWRNAVSQRILGLKLRGDLSKTLYSASVFDRRAQYKAGSIAAGGKAYDVESGTVIDDPEAKRVRLGGLLQEIGVDTSEGEATDSTPAKATKKASRGSGKAAQA